MKKKIIGLISRHSSEQLWWVEAALLRPKDLLYNWLQTPIKYCWSLHCRSPKRADKVLGIFPYCWNFLTISPLTTAVSGLQTTAVWLPTFTPTDLGGRRIVPPLWTPSPELLFRRCCTPAYWSLGPVYGCRIRVSRPHLTCLSSCPPEPLGHRTPLSTRHTWIQTGSRVHHLVQPPNLTSVQPFSYPNRPEAGPVRPILFRELFNSHLMLRFTQNLEPHYFWDTEVYFLVGTSKRPVWNL